MHAAVACALNSRAGSTSYSLCPFGICLWSNLRRTSGLAVSTRGSAGLFGTELQAAAAGCRYRECAPDEVFTSSCEVMISMMQHALEVRVMTP